MPAPDRIDTEKKGAEARAAALQAKYRAEQAAERKRKSDLYAIAARKAEKAVKEIPSNRRQNIEDPGELRSMWTKRELLKPYGGKIEDFGEGPISDLSRYADERTKKRANAQDRIENRIGKRWRRLPDGSYGYVTNKGRKN
jgi:hypothetical protein